jgi:quercetin dioxygenase-like cupin family protein
VTIAPYATIAAPAAAVAMRQAGLVMFRSSLLLGSGRWSLHLCAAGPRCDNVRRSEGVAMKLSSHLLAGVALLVVTGAVALAQSAGVPLVQVIPTDLKFSLMPNGTYQAAVVGDSSKAGPYAIRVRIPVGTKVLPHTHPEDRIVVVLGGTVHVGVGETFDEEKTKALPPGSVYTEQAKQPHYSWAKDGGVVLHVTGVGPTGTTEVAR